MKKKSSSGKSLAKKAVSKKKLSIEKPSIQFLIALLIFYLLIIVFFNKLVFQRFDLASSPDFLSGVVLIESSAKLAEEGAPLWSPYFFGGMPCMASVQYPLFTYTFFNWGVVERIIAVLFINPMMDSNIRLMLFHFLMAGAFTYLLARSLRMSWLVSIFAGLIYMFTPQLIALPNVGHGSKLFTCAYIPLVLLTVKRMLERRKLLDFALFVLAVGMTLLSFHVQMAFYALLAGGMYLVWSVIFDIKGQSRAIPLKVVLFVAGVALGFGFAASAYLPVYEYTPYSIRGGSEGGLDWDYATNWSFHPLESLTYVVPSFFGFGGSTYWGYMPFTDMPLYWGMAALVLAVMAAILARNRMVTFFLILFFFAWIVSFGKYFPILFKPMFELMPFFKSFRVPVMIQILMVFSIAMLAGYGLEKVKEMAGKSAPLKPILYTAGGILAAAVVMSVLYSPFQSAVTGWIKTIRPQMPVQAHAQLFNMLLGDLWKGAIFAGAVLGLVYLFLKRKVNFNLLVPLLSLLLLIDLWVVNRNLINPAPQANMQAYLQPTPAVNFLRAQGKPFRVYPADRIRPQNWYGYFGLESIDGYLGTKMKRYQEILDGVGLNNFNLINMLNARYILSDRDLSSLPNLELAMDGQQKVYLNKTALPRAWLVKDIVILPQLEDRLEYLKAFNPRTEAIVEQPIDLPSKTGGEAEILSWSPLEVRVKTRSAGGSFLALSEVYYPPYWKARVDGKETRIYPTNQLLRGVVVPAGEHEVVFKCESVVYRAGWAVHWIVFAGVFIVMGVSLFRRLKRM
ncbi:MAG: hypothetical protein HQ591_00595 [candidate division Zixibacteria bacterium]|nr:hypothetical protein [Candidatus Tariuqbacter arcticus]